MKEELRFRNNIIDRWFQLVSLLRDERFSSCHSEIVKLLHIEIVSKKLVDQSIDPGYENLLSVVNSNRNVTLIDDELDDVSSNS